MTMEMDYAEGDGMEVLDTDKKFCATLFDVMISHGVKDVVCSPGSRNAPLLIAAASRQILRKHVVIDERSAAFMALGMSLVSRKPVALVCTSGTALLNYGPAIAEAFYQNIPLIVISADRPEQWIDQDDSQTLRQFEALSNYVKKSYQLPAWGYDDKELQWYANRVVNDAMIEACGHRPGPVHINVSLGEPLNRMVARNTIPQRVIELIEAEKIGDTGYLRTLASEFSKKRVMLVAGFLSPDATLHRSVEEMSFLPNVTVMAETISNLGKGKDWHEIDSVLTAADGAVLDDMAPDLVISIGGSLVSRKLKEYLRRNSANCEHWALGPQRTTSDCFQCMTRRIEVKPSRFLHEITALTKRIGICSENEDYGKIWSSIRREARQAKEEWLEVIPWCEFYALQTILDMIPSGANMFLSNGTVVRYEQLISHSPVHATYCNRGVSGIDGSVSTAIGASRIYKGGLTVMLTGDMSMAYDIGSLALPEIPDTMRIIVIDNGGGGIFRFIPSTRDLEIRDNYFCTPPKLPLKNLAEGYGWDYQEINTQADCLPELRRFFKVGKKKIMRVVCDGNLSAEILKKYMTIKTTSHKKC